MAITQNHVINIQPGVSAPLVIHCSQGDTGTQINLTVVNGDEEFDCSSYACSVHGVRSDGGNWGPITCTVSGSTVCFSLTSAMTTIAGPCLAEISVGTVGTANFAILVENATFSLGVTYSNDVSVYQNILNAVQAEKNERIAAVTNEKNERIEAVLTEKNERIAAVTNEKNERIEAVLTEKNERIAAVTNEKNERMDADNFLSSRIFQNDARINNLVGNTGNSNSEIVDARVGVDGSVYSNLGTAIRTQVNNLSNDIGDVINLSEIPIEQEKYQLGTLHSYGNFGANYKYRICYFPGFLQFKDDMFATVDDGFRVYIQSDAPNDNLNRWTLDRVKIPAGTKIRWTIARINEDTTEIATITEFSKAVHFRNCITNSVTALADDLTTVTASVTALADDLTTVTARVTKLEDSMLYKDIPEFYREYLSERIIDIREKDLLVGNHGMSYIFITDLHDQNRFYSPILAKYIMDNTSVNLVVYGGDYINEPNGKDIATRMLFERIAKCRIDTKTIFMRGNHDTNPYGTGQLSESEIYSILDKKNENDLDTKGQLYFYVDNHSQKIRTFFIDTGNDGVVSEAQLEWLRANAESIDPTWTVVIFSHMAIHGNGKDDRDNVVYYDCVKNVDKIFQEANVKVACWICGHNHIDMSDISHNYPIISTTCDAHGGQASVASSDNRDEGTINEQAFDIYHVDTANKKIYVTRIGGGEDDVRTQNNYKLNDREFSYT